MKLPQTQAEEYILLNETECTSCTDSPNTKFFCDRLCRADDQLNLLMQLLLKI
jgi:hypothetical protein